MERPRQIFCRPRCLRPADGPLGTRRVGEIFLDWINLAKNLRWIDVGCGTGAFTERTDQALRAGHRDRDQFLRRADRIRLGTGPA